MIVGPLGKQIRPLIPARYQFGTVDIPADQAMNWAGGFKRPEALLNLLYQGGIAARALTSGGRISTIRMEHAWVKAYVNWSPGRGSRQGGEQVSPSALSSHGQVQHPSPNAQLNAWADIDTAYKQYTYSEGMNLRSAVPLDAQALITAAKQGATLNEAEGWVQNLNQANIQSQLTDYQNRLKAYIDASPTGASTTVGDVIGKRIIPQRQDVMLAGASPLALVQEGQQVAALPGALQWRISLRLYQSESSRANDAPSATVDRSLASLAGKRLAISYEPASSTDQSILDTAARAGQKTFSAYQVRFVPKIKLDLEELAAGNAQQPGDYGALSVTIKSPYEDIARDYVMTSGDTGILSLNLAGIGADIYQSRASTLNLLSIDYQQFGLQKLAEEMLHQVGLAWWALKHVNQDVNASLMGVIQHSLPSHALLSTPITVRYFFGIPRTASYKTRSIDAKLDYVAVEDKASNQANRKSFIEISGRYGSYLEGAIFDMAFSPFNQTGISSVSLIGAAHAQGNKIYRLKPGQESVVGQLQISADVQNEIVQALSNGREVTVPQSEVTLGTYTGLGYIIEDPSDGSAAYQIDGGRSGGSSDAPENVVPIPAVPDSALISILLGSSLRQTGAKLAVDGGGLIVGLVLPAVVIDISVLGILIGLLIILVRMSKAIDDALAKSNPSQSDRIFRHYTNAQQLIYRSQYFLTSDSGYTLGGGGVYVADAKAEIARGVTCATLDPLDIVTRFQIPPPPDDPNPTRVTGFLEITELVKNYLRVESKINPVGQMEYLVNSPVVFVPNPRPTGPAQVKALIMLPGFVEITEVCN